MSIDPANPSVEDFETWHTGGLVAVAVIFGIGLAAAGGLITGWVGVYIILAIAGYLSAVPILHKIIEKRAFEAPE